MKKNQILITQFSEKAPKTCCFIIRVQVYTIKLVESGKKKYQSHEDWYYPTNMF